MGRRAATFVLVLGLTLGLAGAMSAANAAAAPAYAQGHPYRHGVVPPRGTAHAAPLAAASTTNLTYGGASTGLGVTTATPRVYLVFWGSQWGSQSTNSQGYVTLSHDASGMAPYVQAFLQGVGQSGDNWSAVTTQYCQGVAAGTQSCPSSAAHVGYATGGALAGVWVDGSATAPSQATATQLAQEAVKAAGHFGNTTQSANLPVQYVIVSPTGTHPDGFNTSQGQFCAWHDDTADGYSGVSTAYGTVAFTNLPYITDMGASCGENFVNAGSAGTLDGVSIVEGHEYSETVTDTWPAGGWTDSSGEEDGDKCAWDPSGQSVKSQDITLTTGTFAVQPTWGNDMNSGAGGCEISHPVVTSSANTVTVNNPGPQTATVGQPVSLQMSGSDSGGASLSYSAAGLPPGLSISSSGLVTGSPTSSGVDQVTVTATDGTGASGSTSFTWNVSSSTGCVAGQLLGNPGFESGSASPWTMSAGVLNNSTAEPAHSGRWDAWLDGYGTTHTDTVAQKVAVPGGCTNYSFSFWLHIDTSESTTTRANDTLKVQVLNSSGGVLATLATYSNLNAANGYVQRSFNLAPYAGQTVTLKFTGSENSSRQTSFVIDDTALNVS